MLNYQIQYDDGQNGDYSSVFTLSPTITITKGIQRSLVYRVRYRAQNFNGWGPYSDVGYIKAGTIPTIPPAPIYVSSTSTSITFQFLTPEDDGGSIITGFKLFSDTI